LDAPILYLATQTLFLTLFMSAYIALHRFLLRSGRYTRLLNTFGGPSGQWIIVFPAIAALYFPIAAVVFESSPVPSLPSIVPCALGALVILVIKNLTYAALPQKPPLEVWDAGAFAFMLGYVASWLLGSGVVGIWSWVLWVSLNEVLIGLVIVASRYAVPVTILQRRTAPPPGKRPKRKR
jgi:hypothetical protein